MFGYVEPDKPELKIRDFELFRGYYCGVCKSMGKRYGQVSRLSLNYDLAFLAVLLDSISGEMPDGKIERCIVHPIRKRCVIRHNRFIDYAADMNIVLTYYNLRDKWTDEKTCWELSAPRLSVALLKAASGTAKNRKDKSLLGELDRLEKKMPFP